MTFFALDTSFVVIARDEFAAEWIEDKYGAVLVDLAERLFGTKGSAGTPFVTFVAGDLASVTFWMPSAPSAGPPRRAG